MPLLPEVFLALVDRRGVIGRLRMTLCIRGDQDSGPSGCHDKS
jgi:hypothetical protein